MPFFEYRDGQLYAESVAVDNITQQVQTPVYCYSAAAIRQNYEDMIKLDTAY